MQFENLGILILGHLGWGILRLWVFWVCVFGACVFWFWVFCPATNHYYNVLFSGRVGINWNLSIMRDYDVLVFIGNLLATNSCHFLFYLVSSILKVLKLLFTEMRCHNLINFAYVFLYYDYTMVQCMTCMESYYIMIFL